MAKAEAADKADIPDGLSIPEELARREDRLLKIAQARAKIEALSKERFAREQAEHEAKLAAREAKTKATGKKPGGRPPAPPVAGAVPTDQINLTDRRVAHHACRRCGFEQCYNAQALVAEGSLLVIVSNVVQAPTTSSRSNRCSARSLTCPQNWAKPKRCWPTPAISAPRIVAACQAAGIAPLIAMGRQPHHPPLAERFADTPPAPENPTPVEAMAHRLTTPEGRKLYALRKQIPEPVFGHHQIGARIPPGPAAWSRQGTRRMEFGDHGLEHQADVHPQPRLKRPGVRGIYSQKTAASGRTWALANAVGMPQAARREFVSGKMLSAFRREPSPTDC